MSRTFEEQDAGIVIKPGRYYLAMWFVNFPAQGKTPEGDIMGCVWRHDDKPDEWILDYRFRYYVTADAWDGKDTKSWHRMTMNAPQEKILQSLKTFPDMISGAIGLFHVINPPPVDVLEIHGDCDKWFKVVSTANRNWLHMRTEKR